MEFVFLSVFCIQTYGETALSYKYMKTFFLFNLGFCLTHVFPIYVYARRNNTILIQTTRENKIILSIENKGWHV